MFKFLLGDPIKKLEKIHAKLLENAMHAQRNGDMALFAKISSEADKILNQIMLLEQSKTGKTK